MALTNTKERYGNVALIFHWLTALLILGLLIVGTIMAYLPESNSNEIARKVFVYSMHKTIGMAALAVAILRIGWAVINPRPKPLHPERKLETFAAETVHWTLYIAIVAVPVTGFLYHASSTGFAPIWWPFGQTLPFVPQSENLAKIFSSMHWLLALGIILTLIAHVGGALKHIIFDKDATVARMMPKELPEKFTLSQAAKSHRSSSWLAGITAVLVVSVSLAAMGYFVNSRNTGKAGETNALTADSSAEMSGDYPWTILAEQSSLKIRIQQLGSPVEGEFKNWDAKINFNPDNLDASFVDARIDISSLQLGSVSDQAKSSDFLNAGQYPQARFLSNSFRAGNGGSYEAEGTLEIAGVTKPFTLVFSLQLDGDKAQMQAQTGINRMDFGVGAQQYGNEDSVAYSVDIIIDLTAQKLW